MNVVPLAVPGSVGCGPCGGDAAARRRYEYDLLGSGERTVFVRHAGAEVGGPPGWQADVLCLPIAAEPVAAIAVLGADLPQATVTA